MMRTDFEFVAGARAAYGVDERLTTNYVALGERVENPSPDRSPIATVVQYPQVRRAIQLQLQLLHAMADDL